MKTERPFVMEAWPTGTRLRTLRHALRYRRRVQAWAVVAVDAIIEAEAGQERINALRARVAVLEAAVDRALDESAAGCNDWRAALREARG